MRPSRRGGVQCARSCRPCPSPLSCSPFTCLLLSRSALSALCQNPAHVPWQTGNLPLAQANRRFYRPKRQPAWQSGKLAIQPKYEAYYETAFSPPKKHAFTGRRPPAPFVSEISHPRDFEITQPLAGATSQSRPASHPGSLAAGGAVRCADRRSNGQNACRKEDLGRT